MPRRRAADVDSTSSILRADARQRMLAEDSRRLGPELARARSEALSCRSSEIICAAFKSQRSAERWVLVIADADLRWLRLISPGEERACDLRSQTRMAMMHAGLWCRESGTPARLLVSDRTLVRRATSLRHGSHTVGPFLLSTHDERWRRLRTVVRLYENWLGMLGPARAQHLVDRMVEQRRRVLPPPQPSSIEIDRGNTSFLPTLTVATDASRARGGSGASIAVVCENGRQHTDWLERESDTNCAELRAIAMAASIYARSDMRLVVLTDSLRAKSWIENPERRHGLIGVMRELQQLVRAGRLEIVWVRSHSGHRLNEAADRRAEHAELALETRQVIEANILKDAFGEKWCPAPDSNRQPTD